MAIGTGKCFMNTAHKHDRIDYQMRVHQPFLFLTRPIVKKGIGLFAVTAETDLVLLPHGILLSRDMRHHQQACYKT
jgi:hypothetical protein